MNILGIHDGHNAAICYLKDGRIEFAVQEERLTGEKNYWGTPHHSIKYLLKYAGMTLNDFDSIVFSGRDFYGEKLCRKEFLKQTLYELEREPDFIRKVFYASGGQLLIKRRLLSEARSEQEHKLRINNFINDFPGISLAKLTWTDHHLSHAAAAYYGWGDSENEDVLVLTADGFGDNSSGTVHLVCKDGKWDELCRIKLIDSPHSIGQFYGYITAAMGFMILEHEYKLMGMAPYAERERSMLIAEEFKKLFPLRDGKWTYKMTPHKPIGRKIQDILRFRRFDEICGGVQIFLEETLKEWVSYWIEKTGVGNIALSGGVFMNVKANMELMKMGSVRKIFIFPSCGDETNAIGAAYYDYYRITGKRPYPLKDFYLGRSFGDEEVEAAIKTFTQRTSLALKVERVFHVERDVAKLLAEGNIVGTFWGKEEFGARALGNRSLLADPRNPRSIGVLNDMIKCRDFWMPFACSMLEEDKDRYIQDFGKTDAYYMIMAFPGGPEIDQIYAGTHPRDHSVRPQVVRKGMNSRYHELIQEFRRLTGVGAVLNTSFNLHGYPIVGTPLEALEVLEKSGLQIVAFENFIVKKGL